MYITSYRVRGNNGVELYGDDGSVNHFIHAENAIYWMATNATGLPTLESIAPATAVVGDPDVTVTLTGTGFKDGRTQVKIDGAPAAGTFVSDTAMTTVLPSAAAVEPKTLSISVLDLIYETPPQTFTYTAAPPPPEDTQASRRRKTR
jgi:hypothetical protein